MDRTKTSGPARKITALPLFVSVDAFFAEAHWLTTGLTLVTTGVFAFSRDYIIPMPSADLHGAVAQVPQYVDHATFSGALWTQLRRPAWDYTADGRIVFFKSRPRLFEPLAVSILTEHAERDVLPSFAAVLGIEKTERDYLGRWTPEQSNDYVRTACQVVCKVQRSIAEAFRSGHLQIDESDLFEAMENKLRAKGVADASTRIKEQRDYSQKTLGSFCEAAAALAVDRFDFAAVPSAAALSSVTKSQRGRLATTM